jgi:protein-tyrosine phosphatase
VLSGVSNFRDLGGHTGLDGRRVRTGLVFRSDHLAFLTPEDHRALQALQLTHSLDFRGVAERAALPSAIPGATAVSLAIEPTVVVRVQALLARGQVPTEAETVALMCQTYRAFARESAPTYAHFFRHLLDQPTPVVFHCTAGKDRTGFASALLLTLLGVPWETVLEDYLRTNELWTGHIGRYPELDIDTRAAIIEARTPYLEAAFEVLRGDFGTPEDFAEKALGLDAAARERLKADLLEG